jgi:hypothetical protein
MNWLSTSSPHRATTAARTYDGLNLISRTLERCALASALSLSTAIVASARGIWYRKMVENPEI